MATETIDDRDTKPENTPTASQPAAVRSPLNDWAAPRLVTREARRTVERLQRRRPR